MAIFLPGYNGVVWNAARSTIAYANTNLNPNNLQQSKTLARAVAATLKNSAAAIAANMALQGLQVLFANLAPLIPLNLGLDSATSAFMLNRINAIQAAAISIQTLLVLPLTTKQLASGQPVMPDPMYLEWLAGFSFETAPSSLASDPFTNEWTNEFGSGNGVGTSGGEPTVANQAQSEADAWATIAVALRQQGTKFSGTTFNAVILMANVSQIVASLVLNAQIPIPTTTVQLEQLWNQFVAMPAITRAASAVVNDPTDVTAQNTAVIRYVILNTLQQFNDLIVSLRQVVSSQLRLGTVRLGDSLMTFANRELNDYTAWRKIAQINGLQPPFISPTKGGQNVAIPGQQLFLPSSNTNVPIVPQTGPVANYITNYLGVDRYLGPINQPMLTWSGDYQIISGYSNLTLSLGRRLQTTIGLLIYHSTFGSRIPPEIGKIASGNELLLVQQYSESALQSDPRVNKIVSCTATAGPNYSIVINAVVLPNGLGQEEVTVNEVIGPA